MKKDNEKISKSKEIIKKEKAKIKEEKQKTKLKRKEKFYNTKFGRFIKKKFNISSNKNNEATLKEQIFSMLYFEIMGIILCLLFLFALSGGKNFIKLYKELSKLINVYDTIVSDYYGEINKEQLVDDAIESMLRGIGDNYTMYTDETETSDFLENIEGTYEGIGCTVSMNENNEIYVISIFEDSPAAKAGIQVNDIILEIDGNNYKEKTSEDMANYIKQSKKDEIELVIKRGEEEKKLGIIREKVEIPSVTSEIIKEEDKTIGYIDISIFSAVTYKQFKNELIKIEKENIDGLIIDVRGDTGGYLSCVTDISSLFLKKGKVIYQLEDNNSKEKIKDKTKEYRTYPIAVLIDGGSASASEILAATIKESYNGLVVGTNSYGKGTVQKTKQLEDGSMIKYTIQKWLTPNGNWIDETGVEPTNYIEYDSSTDEDNQLSTAIELMIGQIK